MNRCGCSIPDTSNFEFELPNNIFINDKNKGINIPLQEYTDIDKLKEKIKCEYLDIITQLENGNYPSLEFLLEEISAVELENEIDKREYIIQYYLTTWKENIQ